MKVPLDKIYDNLNFASDRLSNQIRTLTLGVLALVWLFLSDNKDVAILRLGASSRCLVAIGGLCVVTLLIDVLQYWSYYLSSDAVRRKAEELGKKEAEYDESSLLRRVQQRSFWLKQITALVASVWLLFLIVGSLVKLQFCFC